MRPSGVGQVLLAVGLIAVGAIGLAAQDFVLNQEPVPKGIPWREPLAMASAALLLLGGVGLLFSRTVKPAALGLSAFVGLWVLALQLPRIVAQPLVEVNWLGLGEDTSLAAGCWVLYCTVARRRDASLRAGRVIFGLALIPIGLSHFVYVKQAVDLIPAWFPFRVALTYFTGAAHIAAGLAIAFDVLAPLAATLEAVMESLFTLIVWVTAVITVPTNRENWVNLFISLALSAAAWAVAESYRPEPSIRWLEGLTKSR